MRFGKQEGTPLQRSFAQLQDEKPVFVGEGKNTFEKEGRYFFMGREVSKDEYDTAIAQYDAILKYQIDEKRGELLN